MINTILGQYMIRSNYSARPLVFFLCFLLVACGSGKGGLTQEEIIGQFISSIESVGSADNLVTESAITSDDFVLEFENGERYSISTGLVTHTEYNLSIKLKFIDGSEIELPSLNTGIVINMLEEPGSNVPLSRKFSVDLPFSGVLSWTSFGRNGEASNVIGIPFDVEAGLAQFYAHGLYIQDSTVVEVNYSNSEGVIRWAETFSVLPGEVNQSVRDIEFTASNFKNDTAIRLFLGKHRSNNIPWMIDQFGDIRWTINVVLGAYGLQQTDSGNIIAVGGSQISVASLSGEINSYEIPLKYGDIHHDVDPVDDSQFLLTVNNPNGETIEDWIILYDVNALSVVREWNLNLSVPKMNMLIDDPVDWFHVNALAFDERDQSILISGQRSAVVKVSWDNDLKWILTDPARVTNDALMGIQGAEGRSAGDMTLSEFEEDIIAWGQHDIRVDTSDDSYFLFDNGLGRFYSSDISFSRGIKFTIDEESRRYNIVESYGEQRTEFYSPIISGIDFDGAGSVLVNFGSIGYGITYNAEQKNIECLNENRCFKDEYPGYGAAWLEYDDQNELRTEILISYPDGSGRDAGTYRARYGHLNN